jgi:hypothetical protein
MDIAPVDQTSQFNKQQKSIQKNAEHTGGFGKVFDEKMKTVDKSVTAMDESMKQQFRKKKDIVEDGAEMIDEEENESIHKTVNKMKKKLRALADLERRYYGF